MAAAAAAAAAAIATASSSIFSAHTCLPPLPSKASFPSHSPSRFISLVSVFPPRPVKHNAILALDPDFYKIPHVEGVPVGKRLKLFNLPPDQNPDQLREWLTEWFESIDITVESLEFTDDPELNAAGVGGFVELGTLMQACMAVARLDGSKFMGRYVRMDFVERRPHEREIGGRRNRPYSSSSDYGSPPSSHRIFVGNLAWSMDDDGLKRLFSSHGTVQDARVMRDRESGRSRGFGFVAMSTEEEMQAAIAALDGQQVEGRALKVNVAAARY